MNDRLGISCIAGCLCEHLVQVERARVLGDALEAAVDLFGTERGLAQLSLDIAAYRLPGPCELTRNGGLVLAEQAAGLGERQLLCIVIAQAQSVPRIESRHSSAERRPDERHIPVSV